ncbi:EAL domain-containing protein [Microbacterium sp. NPDC057407]|uniref:EAL domain-containing protein n=1 Tax=Microbacterium sp. NPDC057407 TaxID=3346120 RepID=UPI00366C7DD0
MTGSVSIAHDLREALGSASLDIAYQLQWELAPGAPDPFSSTPVTVEALCRWNHPVLGPIPPDTFIPVAEKTGFLAELDLYVLGKAATQVKEWRDLGFDLGLAANSSPSPFTMEYAERIVETLRLSGLAPSALTIEITETAPPQLRPEMRSAIEALREVGIAISVDDFNGTITTIPMLETLPLDEIKIDRALTRRSDETADELIAALIRTSSEHGWRTVAEGIETVDDLERAWKRHCDRGQGYLWGQPTSAEELTRVLSNP